MSEPEAAGKVRQRILSVTLYFPNGTVWEVPGDRVMAVGMAPCLFVQLVDDTAPDQVVQIAGVPFRAVLGAAVLVEPAPPRIHLT